MQKILVINPGSTSTKVAVFEDVKQLFSITIRHTDEELKHFTWVMDSWISVLGGLSRQCLKTGSTCRN